MAEYTKNYNLEKQQSNEYIAIEGINNNFNVIDEELRNATEKADQAFLSASNGKKTIKTAITGKDPRVTIPTNATFTQLSTAIGQIDTDPFADKATLTGTSVQFTTADKNGLISLNIKGKTIVSLPNPAQDISPDNPATFKSLGDSGSFVVQACGKNLLKTYLWSASWATQNGVSITVLTDGTVILNGTATSSFLWRYNALNISAGTYTLSMNNSIAVNSGTKIQIVNADGSTSLIEATSASSNGKQEGVAISATAAQFWVRCEIGTVYNNFTFKPQLELDLTATPYTAYQGNQITVNAGGGDLPDGTADVLDLENGTKTANIGKIVLDGSADEAWVQDDTTDVTKKRYSITLPLGALNASFGADPDRAMCTHFKLINDKTTYILNTGFTIAENNLRIYFDGRTLAQFKTWLASNPVTIYYKLATPITTDITVTPSNYATSYAGITNVFTTEITQPEITATAKSELWSREYLQDVKLKTYYSLQGGVKILDGENLNNTRFINIGTYYSGSNFTSSTLLNLPSSMSKEAFVMRVHLGSGISYPVQEIETFYSGEIWRRLYDPESNIYGDWIGYLKTTDIVNSVTINDTSKIPSSAVTYALKNNIEKIFNPQITIVDANDAPIGVSCISGGDTNNPFSFWSTLITHKPVDDLYCQQTAYPWAAGERNRIAYRIKDAGTWYPWTYINDIVNSDTINDTTKIPSSAVTHALGQEIDTLDANKAQRSTIYNADLNALTGTGMYVVANPVNAPQSDQIWFSIDLSDDGHFGVMYATSFAKERFYRVKGGGIWGEWTKVNASDEVQIPITFVSGATGTCYKNTETGLVKLSVSITDYISNSTILATLHTVVRPELMQVSYNIVKYSSGRFGQASVSVDGIGSIVLSALDVNEPMSGATFNFTYKV